MSSSKRRAVRLVPLATLDTEAQMKIRDIRNEEAVRKWMYTNHAIGASEHLAWISRLKIDDRQIVFAVLDAERAPLGVVSVNAIDRLHKRADWAYYLTASARGGLGSAIEYAFIDFVFGPFGAHKLNCEVIAGNDAVVKLHKKFLFREEGFRRSNILKAGARIGVHLLGLTKEEWDAGKSTIRQAYGSILDRFSVSIDWRDRGKRAKTGPIDEIEAARARNNLNWMGILRLALEKAPAAAGPIVADIRKIDREISDLTQELLARKPERK